MTTGCAWGMRLSSWRLARRAGRNGDSRRASAGHLPRSQGCHGPVAVACGGCCGRCSGRGAQVLGEHLGGYLPRECPCAVDCSTPPRQQRAPRRCAWQGRCLSGNTGAAVRRCSHSWRAATGFVDRSSRSADRCRAVVARPGPSRCPDPRSRTTASYHRANRGRVIVEADERNHPTASAKVKLYLSYV